MSDNLFTGFIGIEAHTKVIVTYLGEPSREKDRFLGKLAAKYFGKPEEFGHTDERSQIVFVFDAPELEYASKFIAELRTFGTATLPS